MLSAQPAEGRGRELVGRRHGPDARTTASSATRSTSTACAATPWAPSATRASSPLATTYFFLKHRNEPRGVGGVFWDDYEEGGFDGGFALMQSLGDAFLAAYVPIVEAPPRLRLRGAGARLPSATGVAATWSSTWSGTAAPCSACKAAAAPSPSCCPCRPEVKWHYQWAPEPGSRRKRKLYTDFLRPARLGRRGAQPPVAVNRYGLFGGSFNPPHRAHRALAQAAREPSWACKSWC